MKELALAIMFVPLPAFIIAAVIEVRSQRRLIEKLGSLIPIVLGIGAFALLLGPGEWFIDSTRSSWPPISRIMTILCAGIASSGVFVSFSRQLSARLMACGGLLLSLIWMFNRTLT